MRRPIRTLLIWFLLPVAGTTWMATRTGLAQTSPEASPQLRQLAPGVLTVIPVEREPQETFSGPQPIVEIVNGIPGLEWTANYYPKTDTLKEKASRVVFRRPVWHLEIAFKPMRMIEVDVPQASGRMQRKLIWYMVYRVKNVGNALSPKMISGDAVEGVHDTQAANYPSLRFMPHFVLTSQDYDKEYLDRVIPAAQEAIQRRENPGVKLLNSIEMARAQIPLSDDRTDRSVWGVAMWEDVDPRIDFFSVYVRGLTNAFVFQDPPNAFQPGDAPATGRKYAFKTLQLNFWRPGDSADEHEREIRFGIPVDDDPQVQQELLDHFDVPERLDYRWIYR